MHWCRQVELTCLLAVGLSACGGTTQQSVRTSSRSLPARAPDAIIDIYRAGQTLDFPFEEVGVVSARKVAATAFASARITQLIPVIQQQARSLGADAIIIRESSEYMTASLNGSMTIPAASLSGIAVRYIRPMAPSALLLQADSTLRPPGALNAQQIASMVARSVVQIETENGQGSGFIISRTGLILTNEHVVHGATALIVKISDGRRTRAVVQAADSNADVALLKVTLDSLVPVRLGSVATTSSGQDVVAIGSPWGLSQSVSRGVVSSIRTSNGVRLVQTDAAVSPGNSGGPLFNDRGEVIGIVSFKLSRPMAEGLNFALAIDDALVAVGVRRP